MKRLVIIFVHLFILLCAAQIPKQISYQGFLSDKNGNPVADNKYTIKFTLYDATNNSLWTETQDVSTVRGVFNINLGSTVPLGPSLLFDKPYFLGIKVGTDAELSPKIQFTSVPYAVTSSNIADSSISYSKLKNDILQSLIPVGTIIQSLLTEDQLNKETGGGWVLCDGRSIPADCRYQLITNKSTVPDLRGIFIRGAGTSKSYLNPKQEYYKGETVGTFSQCQMQGHSHAGSPQALLIWNTGTTPDQGIGQNKGGVSAGKLTIEDDGKNGTPEVGPETRPASISVNYFIKIK